MQWGSNPKDHPHDIMLEAGYRVRAAIRMLEAMRDAPDDGIDLQEWDYCIAREVLEDVSNTLVKFGEPTPEEISGKKGGA